ncbi:M48 family metallopeptidase [Mycolicibacter senuensis]|uniref:Metal-dependent hydrolase n=1 Tax=Mycolicibacter senuensis TaxID=386913 RepID=A0A7I9XG22_9MYCO|nr:SprT family zinc-dependent metalloprotease [Mycolicibacter senuensis]MDQ2626131.1 M48 family metallopeptidase [Actinomycetota bacterium]ORW65378.1 metal-dependent hydrolase [Mycolicibacter senuensis]GFG68921.1 metal-dependent hydrolase [Mycolicibacter senuensis]
MATGSGYLSVAGIDVDVVYKDIKHLHIGVYPPLGRVRVAAPRRLDDEAVRLAVIDRLPWIKRQRHRLQATVRQSRREILTGESHYVWGVRYRLKVVQRPGRAHVELDGDRLLLYTPAESESEQRHDVLNRWYRQQLRDALPHLIAKWEPVIGVSVPRWSIRRMKTKWGSCNRESGHIWFNIELAKKHPDCLEYIVVHEMTHYRERHHGERFTALMDGYLPDWRARRDLLNDSPLAHEEWAG